MKPTHHGNYKLAIWIFFPVAILSGCAVPMYDNHHKIKVRVIDGATAEPIRNAKVIAKFQQRMISFSDKYFGIYIAHPPPGEDIDWTIEKTTDQEGKAIISSGKKAADYIYFSINASGYEPERDGIIMRSKSDLLFKLYGDTYTRNLDILSGKHPSVKAPNQWARNQNDFINAIRWAVKSKNIQAINKLSRFVNSDTESEKFIYNQLMRVGGKEEIDYLETMNFFMTQER